MDLEDGGSRLDLSPKEQHTRMLLRQTRRAKTKARQSPSGSEVGRTSASWGADKSHLRTSPSIENMHRLNRSEGGVPPAGHNHSKWQDSPLSKAMGVDERNRGRDGVPAEISWESLESIGQEAVLKTPGAPVERLRGGALEHSWERLPGGVLQKDSLNFSDGNTDGSPQVLVERSRTGRERSSSMPAEAASRQQGVPRDPWLERLSITCLSQRSGGQSRVAQLQMVERQTGDLLQDASESGFENQSASWSFRREYKEAELQLADGRYEEEFGAALGRVALDPRRGYRNNEGGGGPLAEESTSDSRQEVDRRYEQLLGQDEEVSSRRGSLPNVGRDSDQESSQCFGRAPPREEAAERQGGYWEDQRRMESHARAFGHNSGQGGRLGAENSDGRIGGYRSAVEDGQARHRERGSYQRELLRTPVAATGGYSLSPEDSSPGTRSSPQTQKNKSPGASPNSVLIQGHPQYLQRGEHPDPRLSAPGGCWGHCGGGCGSGGCCSGRPGIEEAARYHNNHRFLNVRAVCPDAHWLGGESSSERDPRQSAPAFHGIPPGPSSRLANRSWRQHEMEDYGVTGAETGRNSGRGSIANLRGGACLLRDRQPREYFQGGPEARHWDPRLQSQPSSGHVHGEWEYDHRAVDESPGRPYYQERSQMRESVPSLDSPFPDSARVVWIQNPTRVSSPTPQGFKPYTPPERPIVSRPNLARGGPFSGYPAPPRTSPLARTYTPSSDPYLLTETSLSSTFPSVASSQQPIPDCICQSPGRLPRTFSDPAWFVPRPQNGPGEHQSVVQPRPGSTGRGFWQSDGNGRNDDDTPRQVARNDSPVGYQRSGARGSGENVPRAQKLELFPLYSSRHEEPVRPSTGGTRQVERPRSLPPGENRRAERPGSLHPGAIKTKPSLMGVLQVYYSAEPEILADRFPTNGPQNLAATYPSVRSESPTWTPAQHKSPKSSTLPPSGNRNFAHHRETDRSGGSGSSFSVRPPSTPPRSDPSPRTRSLIRSNTGSGNWLSRWGLEKRGRSAAQEGGGGEEFVYEQERGGGSVGARWRGERERRDLERWQGREAERQWSRRVPRGGTTTSEFSSEPEERSPAIQSLVNNWLDGVPDADDSTTSQQPEPDVTSVSAVPDAAAIGTGPVAAESMGLDGGELEVLPKTRPQETGDGAGSVRAGPYSGKMEDNDGGFDSVRDSVLVSARDPGRDTAQPLATNGMRGAKETRPKGDDDPHAGFHTGVGVDASAQARLGEKDFGKELPAAGKRGLSSDDADGSRATGSDAVRNAAEIERDHATLQDWITFALERQMVLGGSGGSADAEGGDEVVRRDHFEVDSEGFDFACFKPGMERGREMVPDPERQRVGGGLLVERNVGGMPRASYQGRDEVHTEGYVGTGEKQVGNERGGDKYFQERNERYQGGGQLESDAHTRRSGMRGKATGTEHTEGGDSLRGFPEKLLMVQRCQLCKREVKEKDAVYAPAGCWHFCHFQCVRELMLNKPMVCAYCTPPN